MKRALVTVSGILAWGIASSGAIAADIETVRAWLKKAVEESKAGPPKMVHAKWVVTETLAGMPDLDALRREVGDKPDHPKRAELKKWEARAEAGGDRREVETWWGDDNHWRINTTYSNSAALKLTDTVVSDGTLWMMTPDTLNIESLKSRPPERAWESRGGWASTYLSTVRWGALRSLGDFSSWTLVAGGAKDEWIAQASDPSRELSVVFRWSDQDLLATTSTSRLRIRGVPTDPASTTAEYLWRWSDWQTVRLASKSEMIAHRAETLRATDGVATTVVQLVAISEIDARVLDDVLRVPDLTVPDATRGQLRFTAVNDYRPEVSQATIATPGGIETVPLIVTQEERFGWLRFFGWTSLVACVGIILWLRIKSRTA